MTKLPFENTFLYKPFSCFLFRTPLYSFGQLGKRSYSNLLFDEALYLASVEFYQEKQKNQAKGEADQKIKSSLYKYYSRACTRCTPFGLFAGCSTGDVGLQTKFTLDPNALERYTRLDMNYVCALIQYIEKMEGIKKQLTYFTNDSLYRLGEKLRYTEYYYQKTRRAHQIQSVDQEDYLDKILKAATFGKKVPELAGLLEDDEITFEEAEEFILMLIDNQLLKSELEPAVSGEDLFTDLILKLKALSGTEEITGILDAVKRELQTIDSVTHGNTISCYERIIQLLQKIPIAFDEKYLFQTDLFKKTSQASVSGTVLEELNEVLHLMMQVRAASPAGEGNLNKFKKAFSEQYEEAEMPLLQVMDPESGIGYPAGNGGGNINPLLNNLPIPGRQSNSSIFLSPTDTLLLQKYVAMLKEGKTFIELIKNDFPSSSIDPVKATSTLSVMCQIFKTKDRKHEIYLHSAGGATATTLLGRFGHLDESIRNHVLEIAQQEQQAEPEKILAEIIHLPESRIGNISFRPVLRDYEIHYLAQPGINREHAIPASDLIISVRNNRVILNSKSLAKEIAPKLSNAHNFSARSLPLYHFLCDLQFDDKYTGLSLYTGTLLGILRSFPRVTYQNIILSRAGWMANKKEIKEAGSVEQWRVRRGIPIQIVIQEGDNELFIDFNDPQAVELFSATLEKRGELKICEFLFTEDNAVVKDTAGQSYCSEFVFSFYKEQNPS
ncbi:MAG: lantibiotic dehydratase family protein [Bacteroidales bacterium]